tara:strand:- start:390 stop:968 length:579 start_codon:yes stop_codon:yes gene_type:complete
MMNNQSLIIAEKIAYKINDKKLFYNLSFYVNKGEALHICGSNGSGKSTLIRIILGITSQTKGNFNYGNTKKICYLGHKNALKSYLSVADNLMLLDLDDHIELDPYLKKLELKELLDITVANLSFGQQKKLALLRIFLNDSDLIILDEPFVGLDKKTLDLVIDFLAKELDAKKGIIYTSHIHCEIESKILNLE